MGNPVKYSGLLRKLLKKFFADRAEQIMIISMDTGSSGNRVDEGFLSFRVPFGRVRNQGHHFVGSGSRRIKTEKLPVTDRLHARIIFAITLLEQGAEFAGESIAEHCGDTLFNAGLQFFPLTVKNQGFEAVAASEGS